MSGLQFVAYDFRNIYELNRVKWANTRDIINERFFLITKDIFDLEDYLHCHIQNYKQRVDGAGDSYALHINRDSMLDTRRYEYPYARLNTPSTAKKILDVGGGDTSFCFYMSERCDEYVILDIDEKLEAELDLVKTHTAKFGNIEFKLGSALEIPYPDNTFDCSYCISVLEHIGKASAIIKTIEEMKRVTKSGGLIIITFDVRVFDSKEIDMKDVGEVAACFNLAVDKMDMQRTMFKTISDGPFTVACMTLGVDK